MPRAEPVRAFAARVVALGLIAWVTFRVGAAAALLAIGVGPSAQPVIDELVMRYAPLGQALPAGSTVGYAAVDLSSPAAQMRRLLARYTLVPLIIDHTQPHALTLADFDSEASLEAFVAVHETVVRAHPHSGLAIVETPATAR